MLQGYGAGTKPDDERFVVQSDLVQCGPRLFQGQVDSLLFIVLIPQGYRGILLHEVCDMQEGFWPRTHHDSPGCSGNGWLVTVKRGPLRVTTTEQSVGFWQIVGERQGRHGRHLFLFQQTLQLQHGENGLCLARNAAGVILVFGLENDLECVEPGKVLVDLGHRDIVFGILPKQVAALHRVAYLDLHHLGDAENRQNQQDRGGHRGTLAVAEGSQPCEGGADGSMSASSMFLHAYDLLNITRFWQERQDQR